MHEVLNRNLFFVKEQVGMFKAASNYDVLDPETGAELLHCREDRLGFFTKIFRFTKYKRMTPFDVDIRTPEGQTVLSLNRGVSWFTSNVNVLNEGDERIGGFKQKLFSLTSKFDVLGPSDNVMCTLKGSWTSWDFKFLAGENELAHVTKKWAGLGKELFTSADNYVLQIHDHVPPNNPVRQLIMGAVLCIDKVLKE
jgi:uncharacterized protein YxjI